ncbi:MAG: hypothetical protein WCL14_06760 [Bacteroidota bacterium]
MNIDNEAEKLTIESDKIIPILLKHLMVLKNENAFLKNSAAIHSVENGFPDENPDSKNLTDGIPRKDLGIKYDMNDIPRKNLGIKYIMDGILEKNLGRILVINGIPRKDDGSKYIMNGIPRKNLGGKYVINGIPDTNLGIKFILEALSSIKAEENGGNLVYTAFEQALLMALEHFISNGDGQNTLYAFYTDFLDAIAERNQEVSKMKDEAKNIRLEDTHKLPVKISFEPASLSKLEVALQGNLPRNAAKDLAKKVALELLLIHNKGMATGSELRHFTGLTVSGFAKHLPKLKNYNLIRKQAPLNYVLTEFSTHLLLQLFGIPKYGIINQESH